jgi:hypothetical protein
MTDVPASSAKIEAARAPISDSKMLAQVEQWMAMIREINRAERADLVPASTRLDHLLATATD